MPTSGCLHHNSSKPKQEGAAESWNWSAALASITHGSLTLSQTGSTITMSTVASWTWPPREQCIATTMTESQDFSAAMSPTLPSRKE